MLPILRLIPVGGVFLAIAILLLALNPPQATSRSTRATLMPARGALIDRTEHPEWRQFLIQAALRRADEVERLRDLRDTLVRSEPPPAITPAPAEAKPDLAEVSPAETKPEVAEAAPVEAAPEITTEPEVADTALGGPQPVPTEPAQIAALAGLLANETGAAPAEPKVAEATPNEAAPETKAVPKAIDPAPVEAKPETAEPVQIAPAPVANEPEPAIAEPKIAEATPNKAAPEATAEPKAVDAAPVEAKPEPAAPSAVAAATAASEPETVTAEPKIAASPADAIPTPLPAMPEGEASTQMASIAVPPALDAKPDAAAVASPKDSAAPAAALETNGSRIRTDVAPTRVAGLPEPAVEKNNDDITGSIEPAERSATIPVGIGAASSSELTVTLPRERPPVLKQLDLRRVRDSNVEQPRRRARHVSRTKEEPDPNIIPPELALFALLIKAFNPDARLDPDVRFEPLKPPSSPYQPNNNRQKKTPAR